MARASASSTVAVRLLAFTADRFPLAVPLVQESVEAAGLLELGHRDAGRIRASRAALRRELVARAPSLAVGELPPLIPGVTAGDRRQHAVAELVDACDGMLTREAIAASLTSDERREILRGMVLTRAVDNRLKHFFTSGEVRYRDIPFQGKGFRSLGQEAIYAAAIRLRRGNAYVDPVRGWTGDVVGPLIRDAAVALAMRPEAATVRMMLNAQMGKDGPPMDGRDLHIGDMEHGILPATAPLSISTLTIAGLAMAFARRRSERVAVSFIGDGGSSLGEWHEAINACAVRRWPAVFCIENNLTALSTSLSEQSAARSFADKASGYGIPGISVDGTDPEAIAAAYTWAADRARAGAGPSLIEVVCMRMCGHAHHDDMLYLGREPSLSWDYPPVDAEHGYADVAAYDFWKSRDPIASYATALRNDGVIADDDLDRLKEDAQQLVEQEARAVIDAPWPSASTVGAAVVSNEEPRSRIDPLEANDLRPLPSLEPGLPFDEHGHTLLDAVRLGVQDALRADDRVFVYGQDVGGRYGNAFLLLKPLLEEFGDRIINSPLAEGAVLGVAIGAALAGERPIAEIQFNDFVATGFNQLVNNAAKIRYRWGGSVPMVVRMPWGGLRHAGPYHSQNTEAWFYRTPGLKIVVPSTPEDARALMASAVADPDPVLFYEHIALYRDPRIRQSLPDAAPLPLPLGKAALRRAGDALGLISYGAYVHIAMRVAERLGREGIDSSVLDLRTLAPLDKAALLALARHCSRVMIVHEDTRTGGIGESLAAMIQEEAFEWLDAPVRVIGALDTPVPYSPPLEEAFLPSEDEIYRAAKRLVAY